MSSSWQGISQEGPWLEKCFSCERVKLSTWNCNSVCQFSSSSCVRTREELTFCAQGKEGSSLIKVLFLFAGFFSFSVLLTGLLSSFEGKACKRLCSASSHLRRLYRAVQGHADTPGSLHLYSVLFGTAAPLSTAGLISVQVYLNSTSQEETGTVCRTFDVFGFYHF